MERDFGDRLIFHGSVDNQYTLAFGSGGEGGGYSCRAEQNSLPPLDCVTNVATNKPRYITEKILEGLGVQGYFKAVLGPEDVENLKPHPEMILKALKIAETTEDRAMIIGDTANDIIAGKAVGVYTCGVTYGYCPKESLVSQNPDFLIDDALELILLLNG